MPLEVMLLRVVIVDNDLDKLSGDFIPHKSFIRRLSQLFVQILSLCTIDC